jgi:RNA polymerase-binding transcription factor DksA
MPEAGDRQGDVADQANSDTEAELQIRLHQTDGRLLRPIEEAFDRVKLGFPISNSTMRVPKICLACVHP